MTETEAARKKIDAAYISGDIEAASREYATLGKKYATSRESVRDMKEPAGYATLKNLAIEYFNQGASYYTTVSRIVADSGGNYDKAQEEELKAEEKKWNEAAKKLEKTLKAKRFRLE